MKKNDAFKKIRWNLKDFPNMNWHDSKIYAIAFKDEKFELIIDIDYIIKWIKPKKKESHYSFQVVPATLIFKNVWDLEVNLESALDFQIEDIQKKNPQIPKNINTISENLEFDWIIETTNGSISFKSVGFEQIAKKVPLIQNSQTIDFQKRGGINFDME